MSDPTKHSELSKHITQDTAADNTLATPSGDADFPPHNTLFDKLKRWRQSWGDRWSRLHTNQVIYVIALVLFITVDVDLDKPTGALWFIGFLAIFAMARELWAIFVKVWESTFGRLVLLVLYAAIANFALALASQKINTVIGADPTQLYHTQGVATLLMLPLWLMIMSVVAMVCIFGVLQFLRLFKGILVFLRIIGRKSVPTEAFPKTFVIVRLILLVPVIATMANSVAWYGQQLNLSQHSGFNFSGEFGDVAEDQVAQASLNAIETRLASETLSDKERDDLNEIRDRLLATIAQNNANHEDNSPLVEAYVVPALDNENPETEALSEAETSPPYFFLDKLIASFVYHYEAFEYSHCQKTDDERVVYISENDILAVTKNAEAINGFVFTTRPCVVENTATLTSE